MCFQIDKIKTNIWKSLTIGAANEGKGGNKLQEIMVMMFRDFLMFEPIFLLPQVKRNVIISNKRGIYEFPH